MSSPAYDLVTPEGRERLVAADPHNVVRLILPLVPPVPGHEAGAAGGVEQAAATLRTWTAEGVLERDPEPALWLYEMAPPGGAPATLGWLGAVALPAAGSTAVLPHEDTFPVAVEGRRALLAATRTDLEPIVLAHDPDEQVEALARTVRTARPALQVDDADGVRHRLWRVVDPAVLAAVSGGLARTAAVIADGHHRFAAACAHAREPGAAPDPAVLALLTPMGPGGLRVEGIHRVVPGLDFDAAVSAAAAGFSVTGLPAADVAAAAARELADPAAPGLLVTDGTRLARLHDPAPYVRDAVPAEAPAAWRGLDVVLAHHGLLRRLWGREDGPGELLIAHDLPTALAEARARRGVAVLLRGPSPAAVAAVARAGARMPRKSTLFVPKPRTGLVLRPHGG
ncbi:DUF1015 domain-containing protein [Geodermatophilus sp. SYSU D00758]